MAQSRSTPQEFIKSAFSPRVGVLCTPAAEGLCQKNNLSFIELLQPFCKLNNDVSFKDPNSANITIRNLKVTLADVNLKVPHPNVVRKWLNQSVSEAPMSRSQHLKYSDYTLDIPCNTPWFEAWRETLFQVQYPADHEFTKHFIACILVISSADKNPIEALGQLTQVINNMQTVTIKKVSKWFNNNVLRYYVILHENLGNDVTRANEIHNVLKASYGPTNCFLLKINSQLPNASQDQLPDPWSQYISNSYKVTDSTKVSAENSPSASRMSLQNLEMGQEANESGNTLVYHPLSPETEDLSMVECSKKVEEESKVDTRILHGECLSTDDVEQIKLLIYEFCTKALIPYIERLVFQLSDYVTNKKGVSKSLFSATKRWFTPNKPTSNSASINTLTYPPDAQELQVRKLGDLFFMFGHYTLAFQAYHTAKRDFMADQAWLYYAGALEMAALSAFMANESSRKTFDYMEESIMTYLNTCKMADYSTRATLLSIECLKGHSMFGDAANQLIRMTSEDSDLRSALLLEQASYCFLLCNRPHMVRKYAFHMVLSGHRFTKACQRKHSLRCYKQAYQIYKEKGWSLAEDHINSTIGRLANILNELEEAVQSYAKLLTCKSKQSPQQQAIYLKDYLTVHSALLNQQKNVLTQVLPLPIVRNETIKVLVGPAPPLQTPGKVPAIGISLLQKECPIATQKWNKLEEMLAQEAQGSLMIFKPVVTLFTNENISNVNPIAVIGEPIQVFVQLYNPLQILLNLKDIYLLWEFKDGNNKVAVNDVSGHNLDKIVKSHLIKSLVIQADSTQDAILCITPLVVGEIVIKGISYCLVSNSTEDGIDLRGKQLFDLKNSKVKKKIDLKDYSKRLEINVVPASSCLQVSFGEMNSELLRNELQEISIELRNIGSVPLHKIYMATSMPHLLSSCNFQTVATENLDASNTESTAAREKEARKNHITSLLLPGGSLEPGQHYNVLLWMKAPELIGPALIDLLIYYENVEVTLPRYRLVRHVWQLSIQESIRVEVAAQESCDCRDVKQLALTVKVTNLNKVHHAILTEISLIKAALVSRNWILSKELVSPDNTKLDSQESVFIFLKVHRKLSRHKQYSEISLAEVKQTQSSNDAYLDFAKRNDQNRIMNFDSANVDKVSKKRDATLVLRWQAFVTDSCGRKRIVNGQNHVPVDIVAPEETLIEDYQEPNYSFDRNSNDSKSEIIEIGKVIDENQITYNLLYKSAVVHDFQRSKICVVPVKLMIHSITNIPLMIKIKMEGTDNKIVPPQTKPSLFYPYSSKQFRWTRIGATLRTIEPMGSVSVNLSVAVLCPGTYDLGSRIEVWCYNIDQPETAVLQSYRVHSSLIITSGNS